MGTILKYAAALGMLMAASQAVAFPDKPITVTGCQAAGGGNDRNFQALMPFAEQALGQPVVSQYRTGAGGTQAMQELARGGNDGHALVVCDQGGAIFAPIVQGLDIDADDAVPIVRISFVPWILTAHSSQPYKTAEEFIEYVKQNPGKVQASIADVGSADHYTWLALTKASGIAANDLKWMPYGGGAPKVRAMLAGEAHVDMLILPLVSDAIKEGTVRILAVAAPERLPELPDVPTFAELGYDIEDGLVTAIWASKDTPKEQIDVLREKFAQAGKAPEYQAIYEKMGQDMSGFMSGSDYQQRWDQLWSEARDLFAEVLQQ